MIRSIVFFGYKHKFLTKKIDNSVHNFLNSFVKRFESIVDPFKKFSELLAKGGNFLSLEGTALSIVYFFEIAKMIEECEIKMSKKELEELASLVNHR